MKHRSSPCPRPTLLCHALRRRSIVRVRWSRQETIGGAGEPPARPHSLININVSSPFDRCSVNIRANSRHMRCAKRPAHESAKVLVPRRYLGRGGASAGGRFRGMGARDMGRDLCSHLVNYVARDVLQGLLPPVNPGTLWRRCNEGYCCRQYLFV
ncbi:hypothetical protein E2C01_004526 [Portunus trituberculatus]|uniref:Uncharacterized protein n=1 Tax=Portunus trituberculatus TaxID=210409 RepID=A0A5B7CQX1_PORTR|nr:hypothetical protein [Portunus trituberculatus]